MGSCSCLRRGGLRYQSFCARCQTLRPSGTDAAPPTSPAAVSPSLKNLLLSVLAGGSVLLIIAVAVVGVASFDKVTRRG